MIVSTYRKLWCLSTCQKYTSPFIHFFHEIFYFKEFCNLTGWQIFGLKLENQNFTRCGIAGGISTTLVFNLDYFLEKNNKYFQKIQKTLFWSHFGPSLAKFYLEKRDPSVFKYSNYLPLCKKSEKSNKLFLRKMWN